MDQFSNEQRDDQVGNTPEAAQAAPLDAALKNLHTCMPGIIQSFDPVKQTCSVQPAIQRVWTDQGPGNLPLCVDCPVVFPGGGGYTLTFPVKAGDECLILFSERCIDAWYIDGRLAPPADYRLHDLSDGLVLVGLNNQTKSYPSLRTDGVDLRSRSGTVRVTLRDNGSIEQSNGVGSLVLDSSGKLTINAPGGLDINTPSQHNSGTIVAVGDVTGQGTSLHNHTHLIKNVQAGAITIPSDPPT